jgi:hypothetical protein
MAIPDPDCLTADVKYQWVERVGLGPSFDAWLPIDMCQSVASVDSSSDFIAVAAAADDKNHELDRNQVFTHI